MGVAVAGMLVEKHMTLPKGVQRVAKIVTNGAFQDLDRIGEELDDIEKIRKMGSKEGPFLRPQPQALRTRKWVDVEVKTIENVERKTETVG